MSETIIHLTPTIFTEKEKTLIEYGSLRASVFRYESGVCGLRITNQKGEIIVLPYQGQQIWSAKFLGRELTMKSMFDIPQATRNYLENYGGFLLHCGATAMGVPTNKDSHPLHGDLPNAPYQSAYITTGEDEGGNYLIVGGRYQQTVAFNYNYLAEPTLKLYADASLMNISMTITNLKNSDMPLMYLTHINFRPVNGSRLVYSAISNSEHVRVRTSIPSHVHPLPGYKEFLEQLQKDPSIHHYVSPDLLFDPEVVFFIDYLADSSGWAHSMQIHPDGCADYVSHRPGQLEKGIRWICRTADQDAMGLALPATAEPEGYTAELAKGNVKTLAAHASFHLDLVVGAVDSIFAGQIETKIHSIVK